MLIDMAIHGKNPRPMTIKVDGPLVERGTTAAIPERMTGRALALREG
jgi:LacI family transcriptional regulator